MTSRTSRSHLLAQAAVRPRHGLCARTRRSRGARIERRLHQRRFRHCSMAPSVDAASARWAACTAFGGTGYACNPRRCSAGGDDDRAPPIDTSASTNSTHQPGRPSSRHGMAAAACGSGGR